MKKTCHGQVGVSEYSSLLFLYLIRLIIQHG
jgi:hypothetical protein